MYPRISQGRRLLGLTIDWLASYAIALGFFSGDGSLLERSHKAGVAPILVLAAEYLLLVSLTGSSFGHRLIGLKVVRFSDGAHPTPLEVLIRTILMIIVITAITFDENGRGVNERLSNTVLVVK